jgi:hypothetical protein
MRRPVLFAALSCAGFGSAAPVLADSTTTQTVPPGGSMRSSPGAPTAENPLVAIVTYAVTQGCPPGQCQQEPASFTISLKDAHDRASGPGLEGPSGYEFIGPQVDVSSTAAPQDVEVSFEIDASLPTPGSLNPNPFSFAVYRPGSRTEFMPSGLVTGALPDGDLRLTPDAERGGDFTGPGSYDVVEDAFFAQAYRGADDSLPEARHKGIDVYFKTNFEVGLKWTITVSDPVRKALRLKSNTIASKSFDNPGSGYRRIPMTTAARRALRRYSKVVVTARSIARGPRGQVIRDKATITLKKPDSELG